MLSAIVVAAGKSERFGNKKQFLKLNGEFIFVHSVNKMIDAGAKEVVLVTAKEDAKNAQYILNQKGINAKVTVGGDTRQISVANGFRQCTPDDGLVIIHDAARPFVDLSDIERVVKTAEKYGAAVLGVPVKDTVKQVENGLIAKTVDRSNLYLAQTPQVFNKRLYAKTSFINEDITDDAGLFEVYGFSVHMVESVYPNIKITYPRDLKYAEFLANEGFI